MPTNTRSTGPSRDHFPIAGHARAGSPPSSAARSFAAAGPADRVLEPLPSTDTTPTAPMGIYDDLASAEAARQKQLDALPSTDRDAVTAAYRASVERILEEIRTARARLV